MQRPRTHMTQAEVSAVVNDKESLFESLRRNQLFTPERKESIMTTAFMKGCIGYEMYWLPKCDEIRIRNCVDPPNRAVLAEMVSNHMRSQDLTGQEPFDSSFRRTALEIMKKPPNKEWLLYMLATMNPENEIFRKDYVKPKNSQLNIDEDPDLVANTENWFSDLPTRQRANKRTQQVKFTNPQVAEKSKLARMEQQQAVLKDRIDSQKAKLVDMGIDPATNPVTTATATTNPPLSGCRVVGSHPMMINTTTGQDDQEEMKQPAVGGNVIGNAEDADEGGVPGFEMSSGIGNTPMEGVDADVPEKDKVNNKKVTMYTRRGKKQNALMREAEKATKEALNRIAEGNEDDSNEKMM